MDTIIDKKYKDQVLKLDAELYNKSVEIGMHVVAVYWVDYFETLSHRVGYFPDYYEAIHFKDDLYLLYKEKKICCLLRMDCNTYLINDDLSDDERYELPF